MEKNSRLPDGWEKISFGNYMRLEYGKGLPKNSRNDLGTIPVYGSNGIIGHHDEFLISKPCLIIGRKGSAGEIHYVDEPCYAIDTTYYLKQNSLFDLKFLFYLLKSIQSKFVDSSTTIPSLRRDDVHSTEIILAPLNEQKRIVKKIEELFSELEQTKIALMNMKIQLKQYVQSLLKSAFEGKLTKKWRESNAFELHVDWFDYDSKRNAIEKNSKIFLNDVVTISDKYYWIDFNAITDSMKNGLYKPKNFYSDDGIACLRMYNIEDNEIIWKKIKRMILTDEEISEYQLLPNDILINRVNSLELVGKSALIPEGLEDCVFESKNIRLRVNTENIVPKYVYFWLIFAGKHYFYKNFQQTTGMASINQIQLGNLPIPYCIINEQKEIVTQIEQELSLIKNTENILNSMLYQLITLGSSILKQAFEGKLVPQDPNDEPASELLKRIKNQ